MPLVNIRLARRELPTTAAQKAALIAGVTQLMQQVLDKRPESVTVIINEVDRDNFADEAITDKAKGQRTKASWSPSYTVGVHTVIGLVDYERETYDRSDVQYGGATDADEAIESLSYAGEYRLAVGALDLAGPFGKMLSRAGIETAITSADGVIRAVSAGEIDASSAG